MFLQCFRYFPRWDLVLRGLCVLGLFICLVPGCKGEELAEVVKIQLAVLFYSGPGCIFCVVRFSLLSFHWLVVCEQFVVVLVLLIWRLLLSWSLRDHFLGASLGRCFG